MIGLGIIRFPLLPLEHAVRIHRLELIGRHDVDLVVPDRELQVLQVVLEVLRGSEPDRGRARVDLALLELLRGIPHALLLQSADPGALLATIQGPPPMLVIDEAVAVATRKLEVACVGASRHRETREESA